MKDYMPDANKLFDNVLKGHMNGINVDDILEGIKLPEKGEDLNNIAYFIVL